MAIVVKSKELKAAMVNASKETTEKFLEVYQQQSNAFLGTQEYMTIKSSKPLLKGLLEEYEQSGRVYKPFMVSLLATTMVKGGIKE